MRFANWIVSSGTVLALGFMVQPAAAAPALGGIGSVGTQTAATEQVRHECYRHRGHWHCPRHSRRYYNYYGYAPYYYGPGIHFEFGSRHRHRHHRHR